MPSSLNLSLNAVKVLNSIKQAARDPGRYVRLGVNFGGGLRLDLWARLTFRCRDDEALAAIDELERSELVHIRQEIVSQVCLVEIAYRHMDEEQEPPTVMRPLLWFEQKTDHLHIGALNSETLRKRLNRQSSANPLIEARKYDGRNWEANVADVCKTYPAFAPTLHQALAEESRTLRDIS